MKRSHFSWRPDFASCLLLIGILALQSCGTREFRLSHYLREDLSHDESIERLLSDASSAKYRTIVFDVPEILISRAILLPSHTTILLDGCRIRQQDGTFDNVFRGANVPLASGALSEIPERIDTITDIRIIGIHGASIEGCQRNRRYDHPSLGNQEMVGDFYGIRTQMINLALASRVEISGIRFSRIRGWCISFEICDHVSVHDLFIHSHVKNGDGIDLRCGCHDFEIYSIQGDTSDDLVALTALGNPIYQYPQGNTLMTNQITKKLWSGMLEKDPRSLDIHHVKVRDLVTAGNYQGHGIICLSAYATQVRDVLIENVQEKEGKVARESLVKIYTGYGSGYNPGDLRDITVRNVQAVQARRAFQCNAQCLDMTIEHIQAASDSIQRLDIAYPEGFSIR